jgi:hypothetical protein
MNSHSKYLLPVETFQGEKKCCSLVDFHSQPRFFPHDAGLSCKQLQVRVPFLKIDRLYETFKRLEELAGKFISNPIPLSRTKNMISLSVRILPTSYVHPDFCRSISSINNKIGDCNIINRISAKAGNDSGKVIFTVLSVHSFECRKKAERTIRLMSIS